MRRTLDVVLPRETNATKEKKVSKSEDKQNPSIPTSGNVILIPLPAASFCTSFFTGIGICTSRWFSRSSSARCLTIAVFCLDVRSVRPPGSRIPLFRPVVLDLLMAAWEGSKPVRLSGTYAHPGVTWEAEVVRTSTRGIFMINFRNIDVRLFRFAGKNLLEVLNE
jgi:hypothetical protein